MTNEAFRIEHDTLGEVRIPAGALYGAQTQRACENFPVSGLRMPRPLIHALGLIKRCAAATNVEFELVEPDLGAAIQEAAREVEQGVHDGHFPIDVFQTGSGTSTNMNANEVIARLATRRLGRPIHPIDHVNMCQSSNDVIPSAIHVSAYLEIVWTLMPVIAGLRETIDQRAGTLDHVVTTGRTHLMDALPIRLSQELSGWSYQIRRSGDAIKSTLPRLAELAIGGTAVGTGVNAHPQFGADVAFRLASETGQPFVRGHNGFALLSSQDTAVELSGQLRTLAVSLMKIANDLRWMNSGPQAGLGEISLPALQPGSSIMPGKVNPVLAEAVAMACAQVIGNDTTIAIAGQSGNFQLNVMLPVIAYNLHHSIHLLSQCATLLGERAIAGFTVNEQRIADLVVRNPIIVTALNPIIGYEKGTEIARRAYRENRPVKDVAQEVTGLDAAELGRILDPARMTEGGIAK